jgi:hypothetical protein
MMRSLLAIVVLSIALVTQSFAQDIKTCVASEARDRLTPEGFEFGEYDIVIPLEESDIVETAWINIPWDEYEAEVFILFTNELLFVCFPEGDLHLLSLNVRLSPGVRDQQ